MRKLKKKWVFICGAVLLFVICYYRYFLPPAGSTSGISTDASQSEKSNLGPMPPVKEVYEEHFNLNVSLSAPILFESLGSTAETPHAEADGPDSWRGLKATHAGCLLSTPTNTTSFQTPSDTHLTELHFVDNGAHPTRVYKSFLLSFGPVSAFRPRELLEKEVSTTRASAEKSVGRTGVHIMIAYSQSALELIRLQSLYVFPTFEDARAFEESLLQQQEVHNSTTGSGSTCAADTTGTGGVTVLTLPVTEGECAPPPFLCVDDAVAVPRTSAHLTNYSDAHVRYVAKHLTEMYKSVAHFFLPLPLASGEGHVEQNPFCTSVAREASSPPTGQGEAVAAALQDLSCTFYVVATGVFKIVEPASAPTGIASKVHVEHVKVVTVATVDDRASSDAAHTPPAEKNTSLHFSVCKEVGFDEKFWRINPAGETPLELLSLRDDDKGTTIVWMMWMSSLYVLLMSFIIGRWLKMKRGATR